MAESASARKPSAGRVKVILIPVLGAVLLYVVVSSPNETAPPALVARAPTPNASQPLAPVSPVTRPTGEPQAATAAAAVTWPTTPLKDVASVNPFCMPEQLRHHVESASEEPPAALVPSVNDDQLLAAKSTALRDAVKGQRLSALVQTSKGVGAIVGDAVVSVGDIVGDRLRVTAISSRGITLELIERPIRTENQPAE